MANEPAMIHRHLDDIAFSTDGGLIMSASSLTNRTWSGSLWYFDDPDTAPDIDRMTTGLESESCISDMVVIPQNKIITASDIGAVSLWELANQNHTLQCVAHNIEHDGIVTSISATADNNTVISGSHDRSVKIWDVEKFVSTHTYKAHHDIVRCVSCHKSDNSLFISASQETYCFTTSVWVSSPCSLSWHGSDPQDIFGVGRDGRLLLWDTRQSKPATFIDTSVLPSNPTCVAWHGEDEHGIIIGTEGGELVIQDVRRGVNTPVIIQAHNRTINKLKPAPHKSSWIASCSEDCKVAVTDVSAGRVIFCDDYHQDFVTGIAWEPKSNRLFSCGWDTNVGGREVVTMDTLASPLATMDISEKLNASKESPEIMDDSPQCNGFAEESISNGNIVEAKG